MSSFKFDDSGLKNLMRDLDKAAKNVSGQVSFDKLFTSSFMNKYTNFNSFEELLDAGNFVVNSQEDFENIPDDEFDEHIRKTTKFKNWEDMTHTAGTQYVEKNFKL